MVWKKGESGNRKGKPVGTEHAFSMRKVYRLAQQKVLVFEEKILQQLIKLCLDGNVKALNLVITHFFPKPSSDEEILDLSEVKIDLSSKEGCTKTVSSLMQETLKQLRKSTEVTKSDALDLSKTLINFNNSEILSETKDDLILKLLSDEEIESLYKKIESSEEEK